jgi:hypothetical protein
VEFVATSIYGYRPGAQAFLRVNETQRYLALPMLLPPEYIDDLLILVVCQIMLRDEVFGAH